MWEALWTEWSDGNSCFASEVSKWNQRWNEAHQPLPEDADALRWKAAVEEISRVKSARSQMKSAVDAVRLRAAESANFARPFDQRTALSGKASWSLASFDLGKTAHLPGIAGPPTDDKALYSQIDVSEAIQSSCAEEVKVSGSCPQTSSDSRALLLAIKIAEQAASVRAASWAHEYAQFLEKLDAEWSEFLIEGKPMFPLDLGATDLLYRLLSKEYRTASGFRRPPEFQVYFAHPAPGFEFSSDAADGEKLKEALTLELLGLNYWKGDLLTGVSFIANWVDRAGSENVGLGLQLTWNSKYSLSVVRHGGDTGILLSLDLANFVTTKLVPQVKSIRKADLLFGNN